MTYDPTNRGALFRNDRRESDSHPEYKGQINIEGNDYWLSAWVKEKEGKKYFSLSAKPKEAPQTRRAPQRVADMQDDDFDSVPF